MMNNGAAIPKPISPASRMPESNDHPDEARLLREALAGQGRAFAALVKPHLGMLYRLAARATHHPSLAEDAVQEALLIVHERLASYQPGTSFKAWMATITLTRVKTLARGERRRGLREGASSAPLTLVGPAEQLDAKELARRVHEALDALPEKRRHALMLRLDAGLSFKEIAEATGSTEGSLRVLVHLGMATIREALARRDAPLEDPPHGP